MVGRILQEEGGRVRVDYLTGQKQTDRPTGLQVRTVRWLLSTRTSPNGESKCQIKIVISSKYHRVYEWNFYPPTDKPVVFLVLMWCYFCIFLSSVCLLYY